MDPDKSSGLKLAPERLPCEQPVGRFFADPAFTEAIVEVDEPQRRVVLWTAALQTWVLENNVRERIPGFRFASIGFADPETEEDAFGILVYIEPPTNQESKLTIDVAGQKFPLIIRPSLEELHTIPQVHPINGTATCWAQSREPMIHGKGALLTAKHVLAGRDVGDTVKTNGGKGKVLDFAPGAIDAALIGPPDAVTKKSGRKLPCLPYIAQFTDVQFEGMGSRQPVRTKVTEV